MGKLFDKSIFKNYFDADDSEALAWAENVLAKLKAVGLVAEYIQRDDDDLGETDFENYYRPVAIFFSYIVKLARTFQEFQDNAFLANEYLNQRGQFTCGDESLDELAYAIENTLRIRSKRGGLGMIKRSGTDGVPDGELLRLICWDAFAFFKTGVSQPKYNGWNIDNSSPFYRGNTGRYELNLGYEDTEDALSLTPYPLINENSVFLTTYRHKKCIEIEQSTVFNEAGIGADVVGKRILVDPRIDFEITFEIAQDITNENITFGCLAFDAGGDQIDLLDSVTGSPRNYFFETRRLNRAGKFYAVRGILYNSNASSLSDDEARLNVGFGRSLKMPSNIAYIIPKIILDNDVSDDLDSEEDNFDSGSVNVDDGASSDSPYNFFPSIFVWNLKITPSSLSYERCVLSGGKMIDVIAVNKNGKYNNDQVRAILRHNFIPGNAQYEIAFLDEIGGNILTDFIELEDVGFLLLENGEEIELE